MYKKISQIHDWALNVLFWVSCISLILMVLFTSADILLRNFASQSIPGSYEYVQRYFMPLLVFPAFAYAYRSDILPSTTVLIDKFGPKARKACFLFFRIIDIFIFILIAWLGLQYALESTARKAAFLAGGEMIPLYPILYIVPVGVFVLVLELIISLPKDLDESAFISDENLSGKA